MTLKVQQTHINAEGHKIVRVGEVVHDWLRQVKGQLDELEGCTSIRGGEDNPTWIVKHRCVGC